MSNVASEGTQEATGPSYELGSVNVDSLKEVLNTLGGIYPFQDEVSKVAFHDQVNSLGDSGDPHAEADSAELSAAEQEIADLKAQLAAAEAKAAPPEATS